MKYTYLLIIVLLLLVFPTQVWADEGGTVTVSQDQFWGAVATVLMFLFGLAWKVFQAEKLIGQGKDIVDERIAELEAEIKARTGIDIDLDAQILAAINSVRQEFGVTNPEEIVNKAAPKLKALLETPLFGGKVEIPENVIRTLLFYGLATLKIT